MVGDIAVGVTAVVVVVEVGVVWGDEYGKRRRVNRREVAAIKREDDLGWTGSVYKLSETEKEYQEGVLERRTAIDYLISILAEYP